MNDDLHDLTVKAKEFFNENGRAPTINEFYNAGYATHYKIKRHGFLNILKAAGLDIPPHHKSRFKAHAKVFEVNLEKHLEEYEPREMVKGEWPKILCIGDAHFPFTSQAALEKIYEFAKEHQPEHIVQMGDLYDFLCHSKFPRSHNTFSPEQEELLGREGAVKMWSTLRELCPNAKCYQIIGNHDLRPLKRTLETNPSTEHWAQKYFKELLTFEGVHTQFDHREELVIAGILFTHGFLGKEGAHRDYYLQSVVIGHLHKLWAQMRRFHNQQFFELCTGFIGDPFSKALTYTPSKAANYQLGFGWIDKYGPRTIHL
jgi:predicted phosphodiesterase